MKFLFVLAQLGAAVVRESYDVIYMKQNTFFELCGTLLLC